MFLTLEQINKWYSDKVHAVKDVSMQIQKGEFVVFVGPSGCGKSTTLRMIAGLEQIDSGFLRMEQQVLNGVPSQKRDIAMVFQNYALYPTMKVFDNIAFPLKMRKLGRQQILQQVMQVAESLELLEYLNRKPSALSGGQRQRVALARAMVRTPKLFLMDEPLSNLDAKLRVQMRREITALQRRLGTTTIYVTHDQTEAMTMGNRIAVFQNGKLEQIGTPAQVYQQPESLFVAQFIGSPPMNLWQEGDKTLGIRPEHVHLSQDTSQLAATVLTVEYLGREHIVFLQTKLGQITAITSEDCILRPGQQCFFWLDRQQIHSFDTQSGQRIC